MSVGYTNPISSSGGQTFINSRFSLSLGGGIPGFIPQQVQTTNNYDAFAQTRFLLKNGWNTTYPTQLQNSPLLKDTPIIDQPICTPFRAVNNAGDLLSRKYYSCGGPCQTFQSRPGLFGLKNAFGHIQDQCDGSGIPPASCNIKYVYDSSDYSRYLKQRAINKNYNDLTYGGNDGSPNQSAWRAIRRY
uniref:Uncharacterized protein n=1 Tax=viral metagenome TaxID=1070528 RepID=A0A6C0HWM0_9ZZZZ